MKTMFRNIALVLSVMCIIAFASPAMVLHATNLDDISSGSQSNSNYQDGSNGDVNSVTDYLQGYNPVTPENMQQANYYASPVVSLLGTLTGFLIMVASAGIFFVTAIDLLYIGIPFTRPLLNPSYGNSASGGGAMGGMGMGMAGGMGMGGQQQQSTGKHQWVSDEAEYCVNFANQQDRSTGGGMGMQGGMMGMQGGMMGGQQQNASSTKSIILMYLKKRTFFLVVFTVATVVLFSSIITDCGLNVAELILKLFTKLTGQVQNINI